MTATEMTSSIPFFDNARVSDVMRHGLISCTPETDLEEVARMMVTHHVHAIVITGLDPQEGHPSWGVVSDIDVLAAAHPGGIDLMAGEAAATPAVTVEPDDSLARASQLMRENETSHLIVVDAVTEQPLGVISTLDVARVIGEGR